MSRCKSCGAPIKWIKMKSGKTMPVDAKPITYKCDLHKGNLTLITPDGKVAKGFFDPGSDKIGYTSHFDTCPNAGKHRRRER